MTRSIVFVVVLSASGCAAAWAPPPSWPAATPARGPREGTASEPLDVRYGAVACSEATRFAWAHAPRLRAAAALAAVAEARRRELRAGYLPQVNAVFAATAGFAGSGSNLGARGMFGSPFFSQWAAGLEASWSALEVLRIEPRVAVVRAEEAASRAEEGRIERDVALMMVDAYERALAVEAVLSIAEADIAVRRGHATALQALVEAGGIAPATDLLQARAQLGRAEAARAALVAEREGVRAVLVALVGAPRMASVQLVLDDPGGVGGASPEAAAAGAHREVARRLRDLWWRELVPRVVVAGSVGFANAEAPREPGVYAVGVAVAVPLTSFVGEGQRQEAAALAAEARAHDADARALDLEVQRSALRASLKALERGLPAAEVSVKATREALAALAARALAGLVREVELEGARLALVEAESAVASLRVRVAAARARLSWLGG